MKDFLFNSKDMKVIADCYSLPYRGRLLGPLRNPEGFIIFGYGIQPWDIGT